MMSGELKNVVGNITNYTPAISVIIPTKNRPAMLKRAILSVLAQDFNDYEIIIIDDGNGEGAVLARGMNIEKIRVFSSGYAGQISARNQAIANANGEYLAWLDDDDWWEPFHLQQIAVAMRNSQFIYASGWIAYENEQQECGEILPFSAYASAVSLRKNNTLLWSGGAYPRNFHHQYGLFDDNFTHYFDWDWYLRLAGADICFVATPHSSVWISARENSVSSAQNESARRIELDILQSKHGLQNIPLKNHAGIAQEQAAKSK